MNVDTGEIRDWSELTEELKKDPKWMPLKEALLTRANQLTGKSKSDLRREDYMRRVLEKKKEGVCV